jgi:hypothetical protein
MSLQLALERFPVADRSRQGCVRKPTHAAFHGTKKIEHRGASCSREAEPMPSVRVIFRSIFFILLAFFALCFAFFSSKFYKYFVKCQLMSDS